MPQHILGAKVGTKAPMKIEKERIIATLSPPSQNLAVSPDGAQLGPILGLSWASPCGSKVEPTDRSRRVPVGQPKMGPVASPTGAGARMGMLFGL